MGVVYDAGALIAAERQSRRLLEMHRRAVAGGDRPVVPTIVLGQVWRGTGRQAALARVLKGCTMRALDVVTAKQGGQLCGYAGTSDLADAVVAVLAVRLGAKVVTSDPDDLRRLADTAGWRVPIFVV